MDQNDFSMSQTFVVLLNTLEWLGEQWKNTPSEGVIESLKAAIDTTVEMQFDLRTVEASLAKERSSLQERSTKLEKGEIELRAKAAEVTRMEQNAQRLMALAKNREIEASSVKSLYESTIQNKVGALATSEQVASLGEELKSSRPSSGSLTVEGGPAETTSLVELLKTEIEGAMATQASEQRKRQEQQDRRTHELLEGLQSRLDTLQLAPARVEPETDWKAEAQELKAKLETAEERAQALESRFKGTEKTHEEEVARLKRKAADAEADLQRKKPRLDEGSWHTLIKTPWTALVAETASTLSWLNVSVEGGAATPETYGQIMGKLSPLLCTQVGKGNIDDVVQCGEPGWWYCAEQVAELGRDMSILLADDTECLVHKGCSCLYIRRPDGGMLKIDCRINL